MLASLFNHHPIASFLHQECKANINYRNFYGETCYQIALRNNLNRVTKFLLKLGAETKP